MQSLGLQSLGERVANTRTIRTAEGTQSYLYRRRTGTPESYLPSLPSKHVPAAPIPNEKVQRQRPSKCNNAISWLRLHQLVLVSRDGIRMAPSLITITRLAAGPWGEEMIFMYKPWITGESVPRQYVAKEKPSKPIRPNNTLCAVTWGIICQVSFTPTYSVRTNIEEAIIDSACLHGVLITSTL